MALVKSKDTRALFMVAIIVVMAMAVSSPCAVATDLSCNLMSECDDYKCQCLCKDQGYSYSKMMCLRGDKSFFLDKCCCYN
ncbi:hypothetical protein EJB05_09273 [Eragrostis curvula]|uniref:Uncharacterized protein n=1 Tax=Eragrostis curvula TaxID=38414 RepID=A0A5J9W679_9POAL|nr:hypothetical protein EJB05_09273 [Eragrostis curvula]